MNDRILYTSDSLSAASSEISRLADIMQEIADNLARIDTSGEWWAKVKVRSGYYGSGDARAMVSGVRAEIAKTVADVEQIGAGIRKTQAIFDDAEHTVAQWTISAESYGSGAGSAGEVTGGSGGSSTEEKKGFWDYFATPDTLYGIIGKTGSLGGVTKAFYDASTSENWGDAGKAILSGAKNGYKIGKAIVENKNVKGFAKNVIGVANADGTLAEWKNPFLKYTGAEGAMDTVCAWGDVIFDGVSNYYGNKEEQKNTPGMTNERVWTETVVETVVKAGTKALVEYGIGAAVTAAIGCTPVGWGAVAVGVGSVVAVQAIDAVTKWATNGTSFTEWLSDGIIDTGKWIGDQIKANKPKAKWWPLVA